jgi:hypothetical protein
MDDVLRLNHIQMKGTHNSYHVQPPNPFADEWRYSHPPLDVQLESEGVRQFELDVHYKPDEDRFHVYHLPTLDDVSTCDLFTDCLKVMKGWSDAHPGHHTIFLFIEPKDTEADALNEMIVGHYEELDREIKEVWGDRLITPDSLKGNHATLAEAIQQDGWPTLGETRGKLLVTFLTEDRMPGQHCYEYTHGLKDLDGRAMFVTAAIGDPFCAMMKLDDPIGDTPAIKAAVQAGFIVRTYPGDTIKDGMATSHDQMNAAEASHANMISTDYPVAGVIPNYFLDLPGGTPSICNDLTAPKGCTPDAIEGPSHLKKR